MQGVTFISGGQTGVDRAVLDAAIAAGLPYRGWCPKGGWAEDCPAPPGILARYPGLRETPDSAPEQRTAWNVRDSDATMVLTDRRGTVASEGTALALTCARDFGRPHVVVDLDGPNAQAEAGAFLNARLGQAVCIGGPRESEAPGIYAKAYSLLTELVRASR